MSTPTPVQPTATENDVVIVACSRTPMGAFQGQFTQMTAPELGAAAIRASLERSGLAADAVDASFMGCVLSAGLGQAPARQAALLAGLPQQVNCTTINKICGSGLQSVILAHDMLKAGTHETMVAGGMESMSNAPYLLDKARAGYRMGHGEILDHMMLDGLQDAYQNEPTPMGVFAEATAKKYGFTREQQDEFAIESLRRANAAIESGAFDNQITPVIVKTRKGETEYRVDEQPGKARPEKIPSLRPAFVKDGTVTAANSSSISDGAAAILITTRAKAEALGCNIIATIKGHATYSREPEWFTLAPVGAMQKLMDKLNWAVDSTDLFEINEAFAVVTMAAMHDLGIPHDKVNIHGGACALGHPIGASGARILVTLLAALQEKRLKTGIASLCIGGGEAVAMAVELAE